MNVDFFKTWSPNMAWLLGYIWADGCVTLPNEKHKGYCLRFCSKDKELIDHVVRLLGAHQKVSLDKDNVWRLTVSCKPMIMYLVNFHKLKCRKTKSLVFPVVDRKFLSDFVRGYFDGDGTVSYYGKFCSPRVAFLGGSKRFMRRLKFVVVDVIGRSRPLLFRKRHNVWLFSVNDQMDVCKLFRWMYFEGCTCLTRKRVKVARCLITSKMVYESRREAGRKSWEGRVA